MYWKGAFSRGKREDGVNRNFTGEEECFILSEEE